LFGEASMGGIEALLAANLGAGNIIGNAGTGLLAGALGGSNNSQDGFLSVLGNAGGSVIDGLLDQLGF
jgi:hypothetical protein